uniref:Carcinoembryonic antigen-related cell adhesion molecule 6-like n=1 Tax=Bos indicus x Bos taurus TaxID=30522 RepID=A0A4W2G9P3_BOBOX
MEPPSGPASRRHVPWNRLLLAVSLLTFWTPPTTAQLTIETMPPLAAEGSDILLLAHNLTENPLAYAWYRGERVDNSQLIASYRVDTNATTKGPAHSGRETLYPNGTLLIQSVTQKDTGSYTLLVTKDDLQTERQTGHLHVLLSLLTFWTPPTTAQPTIETMPPLAAEGSNILLLAHNLTENPLAYAWYRGERVDNSQLIASYRVDTNATTKGPAHSGRETLYPNGTLLIQNVTQKDTGSYLLLITKDDLQTERQTGHLHAPLSMQFSSQEY